MLPSGESGSPSTRRRRNSRRESMSGVKCGGVKAAVRERPCESGRARAAVRSAVVVGAVVVGAVVVGAVVVGAAASGAAV
jgi:hypothetical protein